MTDNNSHASRIMFGIIQCKLESYMEKEMPDVAAAFRRDQRTSKIIADAS